MDQIQSVLDFIDAGVSPWHAASEAADRLQRAGYRRLEECAPWDLAPGGRYYTTRNGSAVLAFRLPKVCRIDGWRMVLSHGDTPSWRVKNLDLKQGVYRKLETEGYGGMIMGSWLDRPLTVAGRVVIRTPDGLETRLVCPDQDLLVIPSVAIHFDRSANEGHKWDPQVDLQPLYGPDGCRSLRDLIAAEAGLYQQTEILSWDLSLSPRQKAVRVGPAGEYFMSPRIDDLECAGSSLLAFLESESEENVLAVWGMLDNEEVGSSTRQGAQGSFLPDTLSRIWDALGLSRQSYWQAAANSLILSADNGHAVHPNHPEKSDPENGPVLNGGVVVKVNASQKYTTDAVSAALFAEICRRAEVPLQRFANRADMPGGSTLGNLQGHTVSSPMLDIGLAQLAMHSAVETAGTEDIGHFCRAVRAFYQSSFRFVGDGVCRM